MLAKLIKGDINKRDRQESGFTIVEVMIVLAIAGLILAIVFIAVPALQRNARDTQRRADISAIQGAIATYSGNNNGATPTTTAEITEAITGINLGFYDETIPAVTNIPVAKTLVISAARDRSGTIANPALLTNVQSEVLIDGAVLIPEGECLASLSGTPVAKGTAITVGFANLIEHGSVRSYALVYALESDLNIVCVDNI